MTLRRPTHCGKTSRGPSLVLHLQRSKLRLSFFWNIRNWSLDAKSTWRHANTLTRLCVSTICAIPIPPSYRGGRFARLRCRHTNLTRLLPKPSTSMTSFMPSQPRYGTSVSHDFFRKLLLKKIDSPKQLKSLKRPSVLSMIPRISECAWPELPQLWHTSTSASRNTKTPTTLR